MNIDNKLLPIKSYLSLGIDRNINKYGSSIQVGRWRNVHYDVNSAPLIYLSVMSQCECKSTELQL